jgi:allophanate hydrolase
VDTFRGFYRLAELRGAASKLFAGFDALMVPTYPRPCTVAEIEADPMGANSRLGIYTNFVNLLDLAGFAVPVSLTSDNTAYGVTLLAPAGRDAFLASLGGALHAGSGLTLGALGIPNVSARSQSSDAPGPGEVEVVVVGAHLSGMPLNGELHALSARFLSATQTAPDYRLFALTGTQPAKPGLLRVAAGAGTRIAVETWALSVEAFGKFVSSVPAPLSIGTVQLADGRGVKGFLVEAEAAKNARDVSSFGGWRAFVAAQSPR